MLVNNFVSLRVVLFAYLLLSDVNGDNGEYYCRYNSVDSCSGNLHRYMQVSEANNPFQLPNWGSKVGEWFPLTTAYMGVFPVAADLDNDGDTDLILSSAAYTSSAESIVWLENIGSSAPAHDRFVLKHPNPFALVSSKRPIGGLFPGIHENSTNYHLNKLAVGDIDGDGDIDIVVAILESVVGSGSKRAPDIKGSTMRLLVNTGNSTVPSFALTPLDMDPFYAVNVWKKGQFDGGVSTPETSTTQVSNYQPNLVDIDFDGDLDLVIASHAPVEIRYYENVGTTTLARYEERYNVENPFDSLTHLDLNFYPNLLFIDIDNDADYDFLYSTWHGNIGLCQNVGSIRAAKFVCRYFLNDLKISYGVPLHGDFDGSGQGDRQRLRSRIQLPPRLRRVVEGI